MTCQQQPDICHNTTLPRWPDVRENGRPNDVEKRHSQRLTEVPSRVIAVFGPRQTGKTTIVRQALQRIPQDSLYLAVDEPDSPFFAPVPDLSSGVAIPFPQVRNTEWLVRNWGMARLQAERPSSGFVLVLEEIQKLPGWSETVKGLWDADRARECPLHVVILGSSPLLLQSGLSESLAGRFDPIRVTHWSFQEMVRAFNIDLDEYCFSVGIRARQPCYGNRIAGATT